MVKRMRLLVCSLLIVTVMLAVAPGAAWATLAPPDAVGEPDRAGPAPRTAVAMLESAPAPVALPPEPTPPPDAVAEPEPSTPYFVVETITLADGTQLERMTIAGPPTPPPGYDPGPAASIEALLAATILPVPAYNWVYGCSAVLAAMVAAYFDRNGFPNIYTGPTNGSIMPLDNSIWPTWTDVEGDTYPGNPLVASRNGLDGRTTLGSIDDSWVYYGSRTNRYPDPFIGNWPEHTYGDAVGDYMRTSQSLYDNTDGATSFWGYSDGTKLQCASMPGFGIEEDGTYGRKLFYEARGYTVVECYNQATDNVAATGFSFADYKAKIDAGYPVFLNLAGHSVVGVGYDDSTTPPTVYLNDTWSWTSGTAHAMPWGGSYAGLALQAVSIADPDITTAVDLVRFEGWPEERAVHLQWETASEVDTLGFNLYRADARRPAERIRLNEALIATHLPPGSTGGAVYDWIDGDRVRPHHRYLYWLEDLDLYGTATLHGPIEVSTR